MAGVLEVETAFKAMDDAFNHGAMSKHMVIKLGARYMFHVLARFCH